MNLKKIALLLASAALLTVSSFAFVAVDLPTPTITTATAPASGSGATAVYPTGTVFTIAPSATAPTCRSRH